ncbi:MAG: RnfABCDGE type electron transport complex subunit B [Clostridiales bacterium]|nr:RnfABCDGE type electron transport complex subunit B [Clostridiales bacterium]
MDILFPVIVVGIIGLIVGIVLAVASTLFYVPVDKTAKDLEEALPGANCGSCGFSGCSGYAKALSKGEAKVGLCSPGGEAVAKELSRILGTEAEKVIQKKAVVACKGTADATTKKAEYTGINSCAAAMQIYSGNTACAYGCIGFGDCLRVCSNNAVSICNGVACIDTSLCMGCGECEKACPKGIIHIVPLKKQAFVKCSSRDKGADTRKACTAGCIGCMRCAKVCESGAITVKENHAMVNPELCTGCGKCAEECKLNCIEMIFREA